MSCCINIAACLTLLTEPVPSYRPKKPGLAVLVTILYFWCRVLGHVTFRNKMLARYGTLVAIPYSPGNSTAESMAGDIKAAVEVKTGLPLDSFRS